MPRKRKFLWMAVTADEYELPMAVADTANELADMLGLSRGSIKSTEYRKHGGICTGRRIVKVERGEDDDLDIDS